MWTLSPLDIRIWTSLESLATRVEEDRRTSPRASWGLSGCMAAKKLHTLSSLAASIWLSPLLLPKLTSTLIVCKGTLAPGKEAEAGWELWYRLHNILLCTHTHCVTTHHSKWSFVLRCANIFWRSCKNSLFIAFELRLKLQNYCIAWWRFASIK